MNDELTKAAEERQALSWLARELAWERTLAGLRHVEPTAVLLAARPAA